MAVEFPAKYEVIEKISEGGMGAVYKVRHVHLEEIQVIKVIKPAFEADVEFRKRFFREAKLAASLRHPNIAAVLDFDRAPDGNYFMAMEFIDGVNLSDFLRAEGRMAPAAAIEVGIQTLAGLEYLHQNEVIHRDVSPDNIMIRRSGGRLDVKLIDLGLARPLSGESLTKGTGRFVGKPHYASPEQMGILEGDPRIDPRTDLYSLGCVLYRLLTGEVPFPGGTLEELFFSKLAGRPVPFSRTDPGGAVPGRLRRAVEKALEKSPGDRFATARDFIRELEASHRELEQGDPPTGRPARDPGEPPDSTAMAPRANRNRRAVLLAAAGLAVLGVIAILTTLFF